MTRNKLPNRRTSVTRELWFNDERYHVSYSLDPRTLKVSEIFAHGPRSGSQQDALICTASTIISIALQSGASLEEMSHGVLRDEQGTPADVLGAFLDLLVEEQSCTLKSSSSSSSSPSLGVSSNG